MFTEEELKSMKVTFEMENGNLNPEEDHMFIAENKLAMDCIDCIMTKEVPSHVDMAVLKKSANNNRLLANFANPQRKADLNLKADLMEEVIFVMRTT